MVKRKLSTKPSNTDGLERSAKRVRSDPAPPSNPEPLSELSRRKTSSTKRKAKDSAPSGPAPERTSSLWKVGAHVSAAGGVDNAIKNAAAIGANSFALFVKSQRKWSSPPLNDATISAFKAGLEKYGYQPKHILPHGSYLINLGNPDQAKREKSFECLVDDLKRCELLGLELYNFHPGSSVGGTTTAGAISFIAECINRAHEATNTVTTVLENMAGAGNIIGGDFAHLSAIINEVKDKSRVGVCLDTCHMFAAGYDIRTKDGWDKTVKDFDTQVGLTYLRGMHLNDSKTEHNSKRDRHESIGMGYIGLPAFRHILTDSRVQDIPLILETPSYENPEVWATEIGVLNRLSGMKHEAKDEEVKALADEIKAVVKQSGGGAKTMKAAKGKGSTKVKRGKKKIDDEDGEEVEDSEES